MPILILFFLNLFPLIFSLNPLCLFPLEIGPCEAIFNRFYFNIQTKKCESFIYGGCQGNPNNFESLSECSKVCENSYLGLGLSYPDYCYDLPDAGPCTGYYRRYYFDVEYGECYDFIYGGCGGNDNNFIDLQTCVKSCAAR